LTLDAVSHAVISMVTAIFSAVLRSIQDPGSKLRR
jgi:hypothetical protein